MSAANDSARVGQRRIDRGIESACFGEAKGYVMVRRKGCAPYLLTVKQWDAFLMSATLLQKVPS